ncbi:MAG TPA: peptide MFS transporter [Gammaproteobacteria bacterium]|nr:peptide MFS transporter [Gammaproteobacteria bacterium]
MTDAVAEPAIPRELDQPAAHPRGLYTLFFTEMWERFSYYGMRALLVLFMVDAVEDGGLGFTDQTATAIYGLYTAAVYLVALPGGWIADRLLGAQRSVFYGGVIIMCGHFVLAIPSMQAFFLGLVLVVIGTGLLKPNISAIVGELYDADDARRDAGFTIFYMGINLGAFLGPLVCSTLGESERFGWHYGFAAAGVGMFFGLVQYKLTQRHLGESGVHAHHRDDSDVGGGFEKGWIGVSAGVLIIALVTFLGLSGVIRFDAPALAAKSTYAIVLFALCYFTYMFLFAGLNTVEKKRFVVIIILFLATATFWAGFEQAGSTFNLFAERYTDRVIDAFGWEIPAGWFQSLNSMFIIALAPLYAALWVALARRHLEPSTPFKFAFGLIFLGLGFVVMIFAAQLVAAGNSVAPTWLIMTYLLHTMGELTLSPVGLSSVTKLAPRRFVSQMMGVWFLGTALGNLIAGLIAGQFDHDAISEMPDLYLQVVLMTVGAGLLLLIFVKPIRKLMGGVH